MITRHGHSEFNNKKRITFLNLCWKFLDWFKACQIQFLADNLVVVRFIHNLFLSFGTLLQIPAGQNHFSTYKHSTIYSHGVRFNGVKNLISWFLKLHNMNFDFGTRNLGKFTLQDFNIILNVSIKRYSMK